MNKERSRAQLLRCLLRVLFLIPLPLLRMATDALLGWYAEDYSDTLRAEDNKKEAVSRILTQYGFSLVEIVCFRAYCSLNSEKKFMPSKFFMSNVCSPIDHFLSLSEFDKSTATEDENAAVSSLLTYFFCFIPCLIARCESMREGICEGVTTLPGADNDESREDVRGSVDIASATATIVMLYCAAENQMESPSRGEGIAPTSFILALGKAIERSNERSRRARTLDEELQVPRVEREGVAEEFMYQSEKHLCVVKNIYFLLEESILLSRDYSVVCASVRFLATLSMGLALQRRLNSLLWKLSASIITYYEFPDFGISSPLESGSTMSNRERTDPYLTGTKNQGEYNNGIMFDPIQLYMSIPAKLVINFISSLKEMNAKLTEDSCNAATVAFRSAGYDTDARGKAGRRAPARIKEQESVDEVMFRGFRDVFGLWWATALTSHRICGLAHLVREIFILHLNPSNNEPVAAKKDVSPARRCSSRLSSDDECERTGISTEQTDKNMTSLRNRKRLRVVLDSDSEADADDDDSSGGETTQMKSKKLINKINSIPRCLPLVIRARSKALPDPKKRKSFLRLDENTCEWYLSFALQLLPATILSCTPKEKIELLPSTCSDRRSPYWPLMSACQLLVWTLHQIKAMAEEQHHVPLWMKCALRFVKYFKIVLEAMQVSLDCSVEWRRRPSCDSLEARHMQQTSAEHSSSNNDVGSLKLLQDLLCWIYTAAISIRKCGAALKVLLVDSYTLQVPKTLGRRIASLDIAVEKFLKYITECGKTNSVCVRLLNIYENNASESLNSDSEWDDDLWHSCDEFLEQSKKCMSLSRNDPMWSAVLADERDPSSPEDTTSDTLILSGASNWNLDSQSEFVVVSDSGRWDFY